MREIKGAKKAESPGGSKITKAEGERVKKAAVDQLKSYWGAKGLTELGRILGLSSDGVGRLLESKVEAAVHDIKKEAAMSHP